MEKILAIYDSDSIYTTRFMEYFKKKKDFKFEISAFTRKESLEEFLLTHNIEILLLGGQALKEELPTDKIKYIYRFIENPNEEMEIDQPFVIKYQSAQVIMTEVINDYVKKEDERQSKSSSKSTKIISIVSPVPGVEKLAFAWAVSTILADQRRVLFIPLELLPIQLLSFVNNTSQSLSEFIYYLKENANSIVKMKSLLGYNGNLSYLVGLEHGFDLLALKNEDIRKWIEELKIHTDYQTIVFYLGNYTEAMTELVKISDSILIPSVGTFCEKAIRQEWDRQMKKIGVDTSQERFQDIQLLEEDELGNEVVTLQELANSRTWSIAKQYVNS